MKQLYSYITKTCIAAALGVVASVAIAQDEPLPSWNDGPSKTAILEFVAAVTEEGGSDFVPEMDRIATYDNDGTLWVEAPIYTQILFALDRIKEIAADHPEWQDDPVLKAAIDGDMETIAKSGEKGVAQILAVTHTGMTTDEFAQIATDWITTAKHPTMDRLYTDLTYQPMKELLAYLRENGFKNYIVSGGGVDFMRPWTQEIYGIPPEQVIGSSVVTKFEMRDGTPVLVREPELFFYDDKEGKPVAIQKFIGKRPIASFGNSDGDLQMLQWTLAGEGRRLGMIVHHTDEEREFAYDRDSHVGTLVDGLDNAEAEGWLLIDMKSEWNTVFTEE
ncbi:MULTISPECIES: HAD family hydrolase [Halocynthiibacter]|uniref:Haloacid dehalogenase-like hydrolase n=1 Tax=Halocynthiibacter halioticoli TaxID=2986804 RepID=A0AAE3LS66_9RHOB|nr:MULTISPECIES: HAD family hydrolase [Halocynthiibacter]MCV6823001.1 haloacid dehalogenase-like hydrolase [Halocynthiibacter halioticoli]MCW4056002.1 haloacid dehalogenase-like hydrolase [Halocynthiibacter sp. SDUM655004]